MNTVWIVLPILLVLMFQLGLELDRNSFAALLHRPKGVVAGLLGQLVALPLIAFGVALAAAGVGYLVYRAVCRRNGQKGEEEA